LGASDSDFFTVAYPVCGSITVTQFNVAVKNIPANQVTGGSFSLWVSRCVGGIYQDPTPVGLAAAFFQVGSPTIQSICLTAPLGVANLMNNDLVALSVTPTGSYTIAASIC